MTPDSLRILAVEDHPAQARALRLPAASGGCAAACWCRSTASRTSTWPPAGTVLVGQQRVAIGRAYRDDLLRGLNLVG